MKKNKVESSNVDAIGYENNTLYVDFKSGGQYKYYNVEEKVFHELLNAKSHGRYLNAYVKGHYEYAKIK